MKLLIFLTFFAFACNRSETVPARQNESVDTIERQEEIDEDSLREEEQIPLDSTDEMEYYRDVINEGELDN